jgi:hypothetical protein
MDKIDIGELNYVMRVYTTDIILGCQELYFLEAKDAKRFAHMLWKQVTREGSFPVYKIHVYSKDPEKRILELV